MSASAKYFIAFASLAAVLAASSFTRQASAVTLKVACTGTSAMQGLGSTTGHHVPDELGKALGPGFDVGNFAVQGTTIIQSISSSYAATSQEKAALAFNPDIVLFWFGGNDSFQGTWDAHKGEFRADYTSLVRAFQALPSHPKTFLIRLWAFVDGPVQRTVLDQEILPIIDQIAVDTGSFPIDYRKAFEMHREYFPDGMHPNDTGTLAIGKLFAGAVTMALAGADADGGMLADGGWVPDAAGGTGADAARADSGLGGSGMEDAAPKTEASADPTTSSGVGGSRVGAGGSSGGAGGSSAGVSTSSGGTGNVEPSVEPGADTGGCRMSQKGGSGAEGALLLAWMLCRARRRRGVEANPV